MADSVSIVVTDVPEYVSIYISEGSYHTHAGYLASSVSSLFEFTSHTSAITSVAINQSASSLFQHTSATSAITANAINTSDASLFRYTSQNSQLQYTSANSLFQYTSGTSAITSNAINTSASSRFAGTGVTGSQTNFGATLGTDGLSLSIGDIAASAHTHGELSLHNLTGTSASTGMTLSAAGEGNVYFQNQNGVSWLTSTNAASTTVFGSVNTDYAGTGTSATNASITLNSNGLAISIATGTAGGGADGGNILVAGGSTANSTGLINFANSNGISFGLNGTAITASHNGLTTAAASDHTHSQYVNTSVSNAFLTTAAQSDHTHGTPSLNLTNVSATASSASNGLSLSISGPDIGAATNAIGLGTAGTNITWTANTAGISIDAGKYLTTAANSTHTHGLLATYSKAGDGLNYSSASNGLTLSVPNWLTTAANSTHTHSQYLNTSASSNLIATSVSSLFQHTSATSNITNSAINTSVSNSFLQRWYLYGNVSGTTSTQAGASLNIYGGNNITLSGSSNSIRIHGPSDGSVYFSNIAGFSWGSLTSGSSTTLYLITA